MASVIAENAQADYSISKHHGNQAMTIKRGNMDTGAWQPEFDFVVSPADVTSARAKHAVRMGGAEPKVLVECGVAGIMHQQDKNATLSRLRLKDPVQVVREPENEHDKSQALDRRGRRRPTIPPPGV
jgi:hypothetical protein